MIQHHLMCLVFMVEVETKLEAPECHLEIENLRFSFLNSTLMKGRRFQQKGFKKFILIVQVRTRLNSASENKHAYHFGNSNQDRQRLVHQVAGSNLLPTYLQMTFSLLKIKLIF